MKKLLSKPVGLGMAAAARLITARAPHAGFGETSLPETLAWSSQEFFESVGVRNVSG